LNKLIKLEDHDSYVIFSHRAAAALRSLIKPGDFMHCFVYRSRKKRDTYLYLPAQDEFSSLPPGLMKVFGEPDFALDFELTPQRKLAAADAKQVLKSLEAQGYYLQMPCENDLPV
jgi:uncharacterized protein